METTDESFCVICNGSKSGDTVTLTEKGVAGLVNAADLRNEQFHFQKGQKVHVICRRDYTDSKRILLCLSKNNNKHDDCNDNMNLRSSNLFSFKDDCLFCGRSITDTCRQKIYSEYYNVKTTDCQKELYTKGKERNDEWGQEVIGRIEFSRDLHASDAIYHQFCSTAFRKGNTKPTDHSGTKKRRTSSAGRPKKLDLEDAFLKVVQYLKDNDEEQITVQSLVNKMKEFHVDKEAYTLKHMKTRLQDYFGDEIMITNTQRKENVVTFRQKVTNILFDFHKLPKYDDPQLEKMKIIETASKLIKSDIKGLSTNRETYPIPADIESPETCIEYLPDTLRLFLSSMFSGIKTEGKVAAIGHAIMQSVRPRVIIAPLQLGLGVQLHHHFASKHLIDTVFNLGFSCSYKEVDRYENSAAMVNNTDIPGYSGQFIQYVADNVDHNVNTLDGKGTFHGMGIIAAITPAVKASRVIPRLKVTPSEVEEIGKVRIHMYGCREYKELRYEPLPSDTEEDETCNVDILWKTTWLLKAEKTSWNGTMQMITNGDYPGKSSIQFMPMIDLNPSDETCIYSTLVWISDHAKRYDVTPVVTFDQPLWYKANMIVSSEPQASSVSQIVVRLGAFHTEMSFLGSVGHIMNDSGLKEALAEVYADRTVGHMLSGKAVQRAIRGHGLVYMGLQSLIMSAVFGIGICHVRKEINEDTEQAADADAQETSNEVDESAPDRDMVGIEHHLEMGQYNDGIDQSNDTEISADEVNDQNESREAIDDDLNHALNLFDSIITGDISTEVVKQSELIKRIQDKIKVYCDNLKKENRTARLWLQYMKMIELLRCFIMAERTGNWCLHLSTLQKMLSFFAASGHNLYAKSAHMYLSNMYKLPETNNKLYQHFMAGYHVIRRSERYWAGLSTDLVIEQTLMRSLKSVGGLTRGSGMSDMQRAIWILSRPATSEVNEAMQTFCGTTFVTSDQHKETHPAMQKRDKRDIEKITEYLSDRNPFKGEGDLKSISSGVTSKDSNADKAKEIGEAIVKQLPCKKVKEYTFKKKDTIKQMNDKMGMKIDGEPVHIDPQLLFQRLVCAARKTYEDRDLPELFSHELCTYPPSLFESPRLLRPANKASLATEMKSAGNPSVQHSLPDEEICFVIDGGMLLHWLPWGDGITYGDIFDSYVNFVQKKFSPATVVFDGYDGGPNTKDNTHLRRTKGIVGPEVHFNKSTMFHGQKTTFLSNEKNKQNFINALSTTMNAVGIETSHATGDAYLLIVLTAVRSSMSRPTILVGDDTDLLVLLCHHASGLSKPLYFQPKSKPHQVAERWDIQKLQTHLGRFVCENLLFVHAMLGCDTTSKIHGTGKGTGLKLCQKNEQFRCAAVLFNKEPTDVSKEELINAGEKAILSLYRKADGKKTLNDARIQLFTDKVAKATYFVDPKDLPPTCDAAKYHILRVYLQIQDWKGNALNPLDWGWEVVDNKYFRTTKDKSHAPTELMRVVRCTCKGGCRTLACSCKKVGFECSPACSSCRGVSCENSIKPDVTAD